jgi:hypothetical protein
LGRWSAVIGSLALVGCSATISPVPVSPALPVSTTPLTDQAAAGPVPPPGEAVRFEIAELAPNGSAVTLRFVGGSPFDPANLCSHRYLGWAHETAGVLDAKIVDDTPRPPGGIPENTFCDLAGHPRVLTIDLARPFAGSRVHDLAGYIHFVREPEGLATIAIPDGWALVNQRTVEGSPTGRWVRTWSHDGAVVDPTGSKETIDLYQAFDGPVEVSGGDDIDRRSRPGVNVNGAEATLYRVAGNGELVVVWSSEGDGFALVVNETDFSFDRALELAETVKLP